MFNFTSDQALTELDLALLEDKCELGTILSDYKYFLNRPDQAIIRVIKVDLDTTLCGLGLVIIFKVNPISLWQGPRLVNSLNSLTPITRFVENNNRYSWLELLWVDPAYRNKGLASLILQKIELEVLTLSRDLNLKPYLYVEAVSSAETFYRKRGYVEISAGDCPDEDSNIDGDLWMHLAERDNLLMCKRLDGQTKLEGETIIEPLSDDD